MKPFFFHLALCLLLSLGGCKSLLEKGNEQFLSGQYQYAISTFNQILANDSSNLRARQVLAESYRLSNRIEAATPHYQALVAAEPTFESYFHLGQSFKANQQMEEAKQAFDQAGEMLGRGLAMLSMLIEPERFVLGTLAVHASDLLIPSAEASLRRHSWARNVSGVTIVPAGLGDRAQDLAALCAFLARESE